MITREKMIYCITTKTYITLYLCNFCNNCYSINGACVSTTHLLTK